MRPSAVRWAWLFVAPMLLVMFAVAAWPLARTAANSLTDATLTTGGRFVGLANYLAWSPDPETWDGKLGGYVLTDEAAGRILLYRPATDAFSDLDSGQAVPVANRAAFFGWQGLLARAAWWRAVFNTVVIAVVAVSLETALGLLVALVLDSAIRGRDLVRAAVLVPWAIPTVVSAQMWAWMLNDLYGVLNAGLIHLGLISQGIAWTATPGLSLAAIIAVDTWKTTPFMALLSLAALQLVPDEVKEAARVDGVGRIGMLVRIILPIIRPALLIAVAFRAIDALRIFDLIYVLAGNSPGSASMSVFARQQLIDFGKQGYGSAASICLVLVVGTFAAMVLALNRGRAQ